MAQKVITSFSLPVEVKRKLEAEARKQGESQTQVILSAIAYYFHNVVEDSGSSWDVVDDGWYDPKKFYTYGEDKKGHSSKVYALIPKNLAGEIGALVESGEIPEYRSRTHFVRDAIYHRAKQVALYLKNGELERSSDLGMMLSEELAIQQAKADAQALIATTRENCQDAYAKGNLDFLETYLRRRMEFADRVPEEFRAEYLAVIEDFQNKVKETRGKLRVV